MYSSLLSVTLLQNAFSRHEWPRIFTNFVVASEKKFVKIRVRIPFCSRVISKPPDFCRAIHVEMSQPIQQTNNRYQNQEIQSWKSRY